MAEFTATGSGRSDVGLLVARGQLDGTAEAALGLGWLAATQAGAGVVVLDLTAVDYINSTGIALIVGLLGRARTESRTIRVCGLTPHYQHIFELTRLTDLIEVYGTAEAATAGPLALG
jgi:anti-sigma B factor antagonist